MRTGHMSIKKHAPALVHMRDGSKIEGKFVKEEGKFIYLRNHAPIPKEKVRTVSYRKLNTRL